MGFRGTDVQVIADRAGVGKGTVYRYFRNKEDLFWAATYEVLMRLERHLEAAMEGVEGAAAKLRAASHGLRRVLRDQSRTIWKCSSRSGPSSAAAGPSRTGSTTSR